MSIKWLKDETQLNNHSLADILRLFQERKIVAIQERLDTLHYKFLMKSEREVIDAMTFIAPGKPVQLNALIVLGKMLPKIKNAHEIDKAYCIRKITRLLHTFETDHVPVEDILSFFDALANEAATGKSLESLLSSPNESDRTPVALNVNQGWPD